MVVTICTTLFNIEKNKGDVHGAHPALRNKTYNQQTSTDDPKQFTAEKYHYHLHLSTRGGAKVKRIFLRNCNYTSNEFYVYRGYILYKIEIVFPHTVHFENNFSSLRETLCAGRVKLVAEASERFTHAVLPLIVVAKLRPRIAFFRGPKGWRSEGVKSELYRG